MFRVILNETSCMPTKSARGTGVAVQFSVMVMVASFAFTLKSFFN